MDSRLHTHISEEIADPAYRHKFYMIDGLHGTPDGSDMKVLCLCFLNRTNGDAKVRGVVVVRDDPCADMLAIASLRMIMAQEQPLYETADMLLVYRVDGTEQVMTLRAYMRLISDRLGVVIHALQQSIETMPATNI